MDIASKEESFSIKNSLKIGLKTLVCCFVVIMFMLSFIFIAFPRFSLKINNAIGSKKLRELNYQMIYERSSNITDLYNVILYECELGNYDKELAYIDEIIERDDYLEFCNEMDKSSFKSVTDKSLLPYSVNVNGYLMARKVVCLYKLGLSGIDSYVYRQTKTGKLSEYSFSAYVDLIYSDEGLTLAQKQEKLGLLIELIDADGKSHEELLDLKIEGMINKIKLEGKVEKQISLQYALTRIYRSRYYVYDILGDEQKKQTNNGLYVEAKTKLNEMIGI